MASVVLSIPAISCNHCIHTITTELKTIRGVKEVKGDAATRKVTVEYEPPATLEIIRDTLVQIDYPPENI
jgi:copper chaperone CopZ